MYRLSFASGKKKLKKLILNSLIFSLAFLCLFVFIPNQQANSAENIELSWVRQFGTSGYDESWSIAIDANGNIYVTGETDGTFPGQISAGSYDAFVAKYNSSGEEQWVRQFGSSGYDFGFGIDIDTNGNIYITGKTDGAIPGQISAGYQDAFVAKYNSSGEKQWIKQFGTSGYDYGYGIDIDTNGNIYITGGTDGTFPGQISAGSYDAFVAKYNSSGEEQWVRQFGSSGYEEGGYGIAIDANGNIYITGYTGGTFPGQISLGNLDAFVAKYNISGEKQWIKQFGTSGDDFGYGIAIDANGNIYITGGTGTFPGQTLDGDLDVFLAKYDSNGNQIWLKQFGTSDNDFGISLALDQNGNIYVTGEIGGTFPGQNWEDLDVFLAKYDSDGNQTWLKQFGTIDNDWSLGLALDQNGNIYVTGETSGTFPGQISAGSYDAFVAKFSVSDQTVPEISISSPEQRDYQISEDLTISYSTTDDLSGVTSTSATLDGVSVENGQVIDLFALPIGQHTFIVTATDNAGNTSTKEIVFNTVATPESTISIIEELLLSGEITSPGVANSLTSRLENALSSIANDNTNAAIGQLTAFINQVNAQTGNKIDPDAAALLIQAAQSIMNNL